MAEPVSKTQGMVCEGANRLIVNAATMHRIASEWLHNYLDGGPYEITAVVQVGGQFDAKEFEIRFKSVEK